MLTGADGEADVVRGLEAGASDYVTKPFRSGELIAGLRVRLRSFAASETAVLAIGPYTLVAGTRLLREPVGNRRIHLAPKEAALLRCLHHASGKAVDRSMLLQEIWGYSPAAASRSVGAHLHRLRRKIEPGSRNMHRLIITPDIGSTWSRRRHGHELMLRAVEDYDRGLLPRADHQDGPCRGGRARPACGRYQRRQAPMNTVRVTPVPDPTSPAAGASSSPPSLVEQQSAVEARQQAAERRPTVVAVQALATTAVMAAIGALSVWAGIEWLVASLGPSAMMQTLSSEQKTASMYNTCVGQLVGGVAGFIGVFAVGATGLPPFTSGQPLTWERVAAVAIAFLVMMPVQQLLKAKHPPAGSVALLLALGIMPASWHTAWTLVVGIILVTILGEGARLATVRVTSGPSAVARTTSLKP